MQKIKISKANQIQALPKILSHAPSVQELKTGINFVLNLILL